MIILYDAFNAGSSKHGLKLSYNILNRILKMINKIYTMLYEHPMVQN